MKLKLLLLCIILAVSNISCSASLHIVRNPDGKIVEVIGKGSQETEVVQGEESVKFKTKQEIWPKVPTIPLKL